MELHNQNLESISQLMEVLAKHQRHGHLQCSSLACVHSSYLWRVSTRLLSFLMESNLHSLS